MRGEINLLPSEYRKKPIANREQLILAVLILGVLFYMAYFGFGVMGVNRANLSQRITQATIDLEDLQGEVQKYEMKLAQAQVLSTNKGLAETLQKTIEPAHAVVIEVENIIPAGVTLNAIETGENNSVVFKGTGSTAKAVTLFVDGLNQSPYYKAVRITEIKEIAGVSSLEFQIDGVWQKGGGQ